MPDTQLHQTLTLIDKAKNGEDTAMNLLMQRYMERVLRIVRARLGKNLRNKMQSVDVVQEVFMTAVKDFENFEATDEKSLIRWLSTIIQNRISDLSDYHSAQKRDQNQETELKSSNLCSVFTGYAADTDKRLSFLFQIKEDVLEVENAMDQLSESDKNVVILRTLEDLTFKEIGIEIGCSEDAARVKYSRAIDKLTNILRESKNE